MASALEPRLRRTLLVALVGDEASAGLICFNDVEKAARFKQFGEVGGDPKLVLILRTLAKDEDPVLADAAR
jgi:hypothetical protein